MRDPLNCVPHKYEIAGKYKDRKGRIILVWVCRRCNAGYTRPEMTK